ncbi:hypothetical protein LCGC14_1880100 [marine sediment metagenome]|uniref:Uncharacterized protein n=1 Tax=marine sediment metagenome TaxID=412755 RepID=A0A0F9G2K6_9ZZZZ
MANKKPEEKAEEKKTWEVVLPKRKEPTLEETIAWLKDSCKGYYHYTIRTNYVRYEFHDLDDAFRFKFLFERA